MNHSMIADEMAVFARVVELNGFTAAARRLAAKLMVAVVPAPETLGAYQISMVVPAALVACSTKAHVAPVWVIELTRLADVPRVEITATKVLPFAGALTPPPVQFTEKDRAELFPVFPVLDCTRTGIAVE